MTASVDQVGVITEDTMTALASIGLEDGAAAAAVVAGAEVTDVVVGGGGVDFGGVVTTCVGAVVLG